MRFSLAKPYQRFAVAVAELITFCKIFVDISNHRRKQNNECF